ncbi:phosphoribulokinase [Microbulbifer sp. THAF38]|uniref:phosphoribulokinase n=1 Tax=Microbulbifer sp. THAF38 TaxID=2587856 RepID=UPI0012AA1DEC|nr:phosphoribulokinase [Microbulbifer sp. THAF38]QFT53585.1 nucleoside triphosphate hydrolase domain-containing protein [Microbulbifer sp. THAF38]
MLTHWPEELTKLSRKLAGESLREEIDSFIQQHRLPSDFFREIEAYYLPLALWLVQRHREGQTLVVGISGGQGTGKSTLSDFICQVLTRLGLNSCTFSMDDIYLTRSQRYQLSQEVHPLLCTRGVPGTHDVQLGIETLDALRSAQEQSKIPLPRFDKSKDDRVPRSGWPVHKGRVDIVLFEGWCLGARASETPPQPINALERTDDASGLWRNFINQQLQGSYMELFKRVDTMVMLCAPGMESIAVWRKLQEQRLRERTGVGMQDSELDRFIEHYERITRNLISDMPNWADCVLFLGEDHCIREVRLATENEKS